MGLSAKRKRTTKSTSGDSDEKPSIADMIAVVKTMRAYSYAGLMTRAETILSNHEATDSQVAMASLMIIAADALYRWKDKP